MPRVPQTLAPRCRSDGQTRARLNAARPTLAARPDPTGAALACRCSNSTKSPPTCSSGGSSAAARSSPARLRISDASSRNRNVRVSGGAAGRELPAQAGGRRRQRAHARQRGGAVPAPDGARRRARCARASRGCTATTGPARRADPRMDRAAARISSALVAPRGALPARAGGGARPRARGAARGGAGRGGAAPRRAVGAGAAPPAAGGAALLQRGERASSSRRLQADAPLCARARRAARGLGAEALVHRDVKWANCIAHPAPGGRRRG